MVFLTARRYRPADKGPSTPIRTGVRTARTYYHLLRVTVAEAILPNKCFVQIKPNSHQLMQCFPELSKEIREYERDASLAYRSLMTDGNRVIILRMFLDYSSGLPSGHYAELGTWRGLSARLLLRHLPNDAALHCFDTFEGFSESDVEKECRKIGIHISSRQFDDTSPQIASRTILDGRDHDPRLVLHAGEFPATFEGLETAKWRLVHLDADLYSPTNSALERFYPNVVPGGVILMHDYYSFFEGVAAAAHDYFTPLGIVPVPMCDKAGTAVVIRPLN